MVNRQCGILFKGSISLYVMNIYLESIVFPNKGSHNISVALISNKKVNKGYNAHDLPIAPFLTTNHYSLENILLLFH